MVAVALRKHLKGKIEMAKDRPTVRFKYWSNRNISFTGTVDSGVTWDDWHRMDADARADVEQEALGKIVELAMIETEDPGPPDDDEGEDDQKG